MTLPTPGWWPSSVANIPLTDEGDPDRRAVLEPWPEPLVSDGRRVAFCGCQLCASLRFETGP